MKNQPATHFPELITSLDYVNPIIKKLFPHHLKNTPLTGRISNFVSKWSKLTNDKEIIQIVKSLKIQFLERPSQKQPLAETKMSLEEKKLVNTEVQELLRKGAITPAQVSEDQFVSNIFLRLKEDGCFHLIINLKKLNQFISIFALQNGRPKTTKRFSQAKRFNVKNKSQRCQHSPASRNTQVCKVSMERESIPIPMALFWPGTCSQDLHQTFKNFYINSMENKHLIDNLPQQYSNYGEESGGNLNDSRQ